MVEVEMIMFYDMKTLNGNKSFFRMTFTGWRLSCYEDNIPAEYLNTTIIYREEKQPMMLIENYDDDELVDRFTFALLNHGDINQLHVVESIHEKFVDPCKSKRNII
ncbi:hypothetical protein RF11_11098 [Thelohanellus kitauei]|uniref:Uncharacterized protein n=1 Tax=Thelohanellus kitauei TaxID=669202 RepID=A0A0C2N688_THEKT|nr:hypothetical protein RF11_11098 [Thelohanellus kitauei]